MNYRSAAMGALLIRLLEKSDVDPAAESTSSDSGSRYGHKVVMPRPETISPYDGPYIKPPTYKGARKKFKECLKKLGIREEDAYMLITKNCDEAYMRYPITIYLKRDIDWARLHKFLKPGAKGTRNVFNYSPQVQITKGILRGE